MHTSHLQLSESAAAAALELLASLSRLDLLLSRAAEQVPAVYGAESASDRFRGLYIGRGDAERLLGRSPGEPLFAPPPAPMQVEANSRLDWLAHAYGLSGFDLDVVILALAPELDARYERLYGYLQDDVTRRLPTVDLALHMLAEDAADRIARRWHFSADAPLVRERLIELVPEPGAPAPTLLSHGIRLDEQIVHLLLEQDSLDRRLAPFCTIVEPAEGLDAEVSDAAVADALRRRVLEARRRREPLRLVFHGPPGSGKRTAARALSAAAGCDLLVVDGERLRRHGPEPRTALELAVRQAWFHDAFLLLVRADALAGEMPGGVGSALARLPNPAIVAVDGEGAGLGLDGWLRVDFTVPAPAVRLRLWAAALADAQAEAEPALVAALANRFRLHPGNIRAAAEAAVAAASLRVCGNGGSPLLTGRELFAAASDQTGGALERLATRLRPVTEWDALVLPEDELAQLRELCERVLHRERVLDDWGFAHRLTRGRGVNALFSGPSGTGKTMAAEVLAARLGVDLWRIELAGVVSKYIGETEKNLDRIFAAAEGADGILFFDEAEALFGKRSEVRDSHDRYANLEIAYLLQKMEQFDGLAILATNRRGNLDEAFVRRLAFSIHFPFPDEASRRRIWQGIFPPDTPLAEDVDLDRLARDIQLSGGHIRNIAVAAAFLAAPESRPVTMHDLEHATRREYRKLGKTTTPLVVTVP